MSIPFVDDRSILFRPLVGQADATHLANARKLALLRLFFKKSNDLRIDESRLLVGLVRVYEVMGNVVSGGKLESLDAAWAKTAPVCDQFARHMIVRRCIRGSCHDQN